MFEFFVDSVEPNVMDEEPFPLSTLNKSLFLAGVQCLKRLHLLVHQPELAAKVDAEELGESPNFRGGSIRE